MKAHLTVLVGYERLILNVLKQEETKKRSSSEAFYDLLI